MKNIKVLALSVALALPVQAHAYEAVAPVLVDWTQQLKGLNGVAITCLRTIDRKYALRACEALMDHASAALTRSGIPHESRGIYNINNDYPDPESKFTAPLNLIIHMRGTDGNPIALDLRIHASVTYKAAVESGKGGDGRAGELLMWQHGLSGSGPSRQLEPAAIQAGKKRMDDILSILDEHWPN